VLEEAPDGHPDGVLSLKTSVALGRGRIEFALASDVKSYRLIWILFGCYVAPAHRAATSGAPSRAFHFFGPLAYWKCWGNYYGDRTDRHTGPGTRIPEPLKASFSQLISFEYLFGVVETDVCLGKGDEYAPPAFLEYLFAFTMVCARDSQQ